MRLTDYVVIPPDRLSNEKLKLARSKGGIILSEPESPYKGTSYVMAKCGLLVDRSFHKLNIPVEELCVIQNKHSDKAEAYKVAKRLVNLRKCLRAKRND